MTVTSATNRNDYVGNATASEYDYTFRILLNTDLLCTVKHPTTGVETTLVITTDYTVSGVGAGGGGSITLVDSGQAWLDADGDLDTDWVLTIRLKTSLTQGTDIRNQGSYQPSALEDALDKRAMVDLQQQDEIDRSLKLPETLAPSDFSAILPSTLPDSAGATIVVNEDGDGFEIGPTATQISSAQGYAEDAEDAATAAEASETAAAASESAAASSASAAAASALTAAAAVNSVAFRDVTFLTFADSPYTLTTADRGKLFAIDTSGGAFAFNLIAIAGLNLTSAFMFGIKKTTGDGNSITVTRASTDTIDGGTTKTLSVASGGAVFVPDTDPSPDEWTTTEFGASAGNLTVDRFSGDGSDVTFTLSVDPGSENNTHVYVEGVYQQKDTYSVSGTTLTFSTAPPAGTDNIEVISGTTLSVGTPSDSTVSRAKLVAGAIAAGNVTGSKTANYTATTEDDIIPCDTSGGAFTVTLYAASGNAGRRLTLVKTSNDFTALTIDGNDSETINGATTTTLNTQYEAVTLLCDGSNWFIEQRRIPKTTTTTTNAITGTTSNPSKGSVVRDIFSWYRDGQFLVGDIFYEHNGAGSAGSGTYLFALPSGLALDTGWIAASTDGSVDVGTAQISNTTTGLGASTSDGILFPYDSTHIAIGRFDTDTSNRRDSLSLVGSPTLGLDQTNIIYVGHFRLKISGWNG